MFLYNYVFLSIRVLDQEDAVNARRKVEARGRSGGRSLPYDAYQEFPVVRFFQFL